MTDHSVNFGKISLKGQMKIQQTAFLLIAVTLFFVMVGIIVLGFKLSGLKGEVSSLEEKNALLLATRLANSPEFSCGESFGTLKLNCVDEDKVMALKENEVTYKGFWGSTGVEIRKIYPPLTSTIECTLGNYPNCNMIRIRGSELGGISVGNFVSLCRKEKDGGEFYDKCELAQLLVTYKKIE